MKEPMCPVQGQLHRTRHERPRGHVPSIDFFLPFQNGLFFFWREIGICFLFFNLKKQTHKLSTCSSSFSRGFVIRFEQSVSPRNDHVQEPPWHTALSQHLTTRDSQLPLAVTVRDHCMLTLAWGLLWTRICSDDSRNVPGLCRRRMEYVWVFITVSLVSVYPGGKCRQVCRLWKSRWLLLYFFSLNVSFLTPNLLKLHFIVPLELTLISVSNGLEETPGRLISCIVQKINHRHFFFWAWK